MLGEFGYNGTEVGTILGSFGTLIWRFVLC